MVRVRVRVSVIDRVKVTVIDSFRVRVRSLFFRLSLGVSM
jgi:hypothetical protein